MSDSKQATTVKLPLADLPPGEVKCVEVAGEPVAVANVEGAVYAIHDTCTHADASLSAGFLEGHELFCPWHGAAFDVRSGAATCGPAEMPCRRYAARIEGDQVIVTDEQADQLPPGPPS